MSAGVPPTLGLSCEHDRAPRAAARRRRRAARRLSAPGVRRRSVACRRPSRAHRCRLLAEGRPTLERQRSTVSSPTTSCVRRGLRPRARPRSPVGRARSSLTAPVVLEGPWPRDAHREGKSATRGADHGRGRGPWPSGRSCLPVGRSRRERRARETTDPAPPRSSTASPTAAPSDCCPDTGPDGPARLRRRRQPPSRPQRRGRRPTGSGRATR